MGLLCLFSKCIFCIISVPAWQLVLWLSVLITCGHPVPCRHVGKLLGSQFPLNTSLIWHLLCKITSWPPEIWFLHLSCSLFVTSHLHIPLLWCFHHIFLSERLGIMVASFSPHVTCPLLMYSSASCWWSWFSFLSIASFPFHWISLCLLLCSFESWLRVCVAWVLQS